MFPAREAMALVSQTGLPPLFHRTPTRHQSLQKCYTLKRNGFNIVLDEYHFSRSHRDKDLMKPVPAPSKDGGISAGKVYENGS